MTSKAQMLSWYMGNFQRIPHGKKNPEKKYLRNDQILELFNGKVHIQELLDGKMKIKRMHDNDSAPLYVSIDLKESKQIPYREINCGFDVWLDEIKINEGNPVIDDPFYDVQTQGLLPFDYCVINGSKLRLEQILDLLGTLSRLSSHFGYERIKGLAIKNYELQLFARWINDEYEDK